METPSLVDSLADYSVKRNLYAFHEWFISSAPQESITLDDEFEQSYAEKVFALSSANAFKIWQLFLSHFQYCRHDQVKLFGLFLAHIKVLDGQNELNSAPLEELMQQTATAMHDFTLKDQHVLPIYHALLCLKLLCRQFRGSESTADEQLLPQLYDLSDVFEQTKPKQWADLYEHFDALQEVYQLTYAKMMTVKYRIAQLNNIERQGDDEAVREHQLSELLAKVTSNGNLICFEVLQPVIGELNHQGLLFLLEHLFQSLVDDSKLDEQITRILSLPSVWENVHFQSAFISALLRQLTACLNCSKRKSPEKEEEEGDIAAPVSTVLSTLCSKDKLWAKHATIVPDATNPKHDKILQLVKSAGNAFLATASRQAQLEVPTKSKSILKLIELFLKCAPLEHLQPVNQLRSILALSTLLVSLKLKAKEKTKLADLFVGINQRIWDSVRSLWLFDFVSPSEYIYQMLCHLQSNLDNRCYTLFNCYISNVFRLFALEQSQQNVSTLVEMLSANERSVKVEYVFMVQTMILRNNAQFVKKLENNVKFASHVAAFEQIGASVSSLLYKNIKRYLEDSDAFDHLDSEFVVEGLTKLFEYKVFASLSPTEESTLKSKWRKLLTRFIAISLENLSSANVNKSFVNFLKVVVQNREKLHFTLSDTFVLDLWCKVTQVQLEDSDALEALNAKLSSTSHWRKVLQKAKVHGKFVQLYGEITESSPVLFGQHLESYCALLDTVHPLLIPIAQSATAAEFGQIVANCTEMLSQSNLARAVFAIKLLLQLLLANIDSEKCRLLADNFTAILSSLINISFLCSKSHLRNERQVQLHGRLGALELTKELLSRLLAHDLLSNAHLFLAYNLCAECGLVHLTSDLSLFGGFFSALNGLIFELIMRRPHLAIFSMCSQLNLLSTMLVALLRSSDEKNLENATDQEKLSLEKCSKSFNATLTQLCNEDDFKPFAAHLIAHYLHHSPHYSVVYFVKKNLTAAIFNLIDLVKDKDAIERLYSRLTQGSREILKLLLEHYDKYHRFKGYV